MPRNVSNSTLRHMDNPCLSTTLEGACQASTFREGGSLRPTLDKSVVSIKITFRNNLTRTQTEEQQLGPV